MTEKEIINKLLWLEKEKAITDRKFQSVFETLNKLKKNSDDVVKRQVENIEKRIAISEGDIEILYSTVDLIRGIETYEGDRQIYPSQDIIPDLGEENNAEEIIEKNERKENTQKFLMEHKEKEEENLSQKLAKKWKEEKKEEVKKELKIEISGYCFDDKELNKKEKK